MLWCKTVKIFFLVIFSILINLDFINSLPFRKKPVERQEVKKYSSKQEESIDPDSNECYKNDNQFFPGKITFSEETLKEDAGMIFIISIV